MSREFRLLAAIAGLLAVTVPAALAQSTSPPPPAPVASVVGDDYIIGPGDALQIYVWQNPDLTINVPVRSDGKITTPLVEDMTAVGKSPTQLARDIETVLAEYVRTPRVNVFVTQSANAYSQVKVMGQVVQPQAVAYREGMTVLDAILAAGGLGRFARGNDGKLIRTENGKQTETRVRINRLLDGDMSQDLKLRPGDILLVPESRF
ncbi:MAG TPA: XrtA/PEP-CTERM system exopolysaccharide export protein [Steroidobacteraceae bacterium]|nr:XrtA/PEP-CTERM system exopolysaccharide export protein [Steroidobacteraceae bacterium]